MTQPQVIQGTWEELSALAEAYKDRDDLLLIIPARETEQSGLSSGSLAEDEARRQAAIQAARGSMTHIPVSVDDLHQERQRDKAREGQKPSPCL